MKPDPTAPMMQIDDAMTLAEEIALRRPRFPLRFLRRFVYLVVRDRAELFASEKDALVNAMASACGCDAASIRLDVERMAEERERHADESTLERITGMTGPEPEPRDDAYPGQYL